MAMKRVMTVDEAVRWAYREQLPRAVADRGKLGPAGYTSSAKAANVAADYWCIPDNQFGVLPFVQADDEPAPDAIRVHRAVTELDAVEVEINSGWIQRDLAALGPAGEAACVRAMEIETMLVGSRRKLRRPVSSIVRDAAILGLADGQFDEPPVLKTLMEQGKPKYFRRVVIAGEEGGYEVEVDGFDRKRRMPYPDAYTKTRVEPDPVPVLCDRAVYQVWRSAIDVLFETLCNELRAIDLRPSTAARAPWLHPTSPVVLEAAVVDSGLHPQPRDRRA